MNNKKNVVRVPTHLKGSVSVSHNKVYDNRSHSARIIFGVGFTTLVFGIPALR